jgi:hypothetical protein
VKGQPCQDIVRGQVLTRVRKKADPLPRLPHPNSMACALLLSASAFTMALGVTVLIAVWTLLFSLAWRTA